MEVRFHKTFRKKFRKLPPKVQERFYARLRIFITDKFDPRLHNHSVDRAFDNCHCSNVTGDYHAIFYENSGEIIFIAIGTHAELYS